MEELLKRAEWMKKDYPNLKEEIDSIVQLCKDEIEEGGSPNNEISHAFHALDELL